MRIDAGTARLQRSLDTCKKCRVSTPAWPAKPPSVDTRREEEEEETRRRGEAPGPTGPRELKDG